MGNNNTQMAHVQHTAQQHIRNSKCALIGTDNTGKTTFASYKNANYKFNPNAIYKPTIGAAFIAHDIPKPYDPPHHLKLEIWDTAGQSRYRSLQSMYYRGAHIVLVFYDCTNRDSFYRAKESLQEVATRRVLLLLANKCDLKHARVVSCEEGKNLAEEYNAAFNEISCTKPEDIVEVFSYIAHRLVNRAFVLNYRKYSPELKVSRNNRLCDINIITTA